MRSSDELRAAGRLTTKLGSLPVLAIFKLGWTNIVDGVKQFKGPAGFDPALADSGLLAGAEAYEANLEDAVSAGAFGAPFFITDDGARFWGQDRIDQLDMHLGGQL